MFAVAPVPVSEDDCVPAVSLMLSVPVRVPLAVGVKFTPIEQLLPAARLEPQPLLAIPKSPEAVTAVMETAEAVLFVSVAVCAALVVPTVWLAKVMLVGDSVTEPPVVAPPVPVSDAV